MTSGYAFPSMDSFDELWWVLMAYILLRLIKRDQPRLWLFFGLVAGIGLMTKVTMLMFGFALVAGLVLLPQRKYLLNKWAWVSGAIAFAFLLPYSLWNAANGWPTLEFWSTYTNGHANPATALGFFSQQVLTMNPLTLPLWLALIFLLQEACVCFILHAHIHGHKTCLPWTWTTNDAAWR